LVGADLRGCGDRETGEVMGVLWAARDSYFTAYCRRERVRNMRDGGGGWCTVVTASIQWDRGGNECRAQGVKSLKGGGDQGD